MVPFQKLLSLKSATKGEILYVNTVTIDRNVLSLAFGGVSILQER